MKRGNILLILVMTLLVLPFASATVSLSVDGPTQSAFNVGDKISISGEISSTNAIEAMLKMTVKCGENEFPFPPVQVILDDGQEKSFPGELDVPEITALASMGTGCYVDAILSKDGTDLAYASSNDFDVTKILMGSFAIQEEKIQRGQDIVLSGIIERLDGTPIEGKADIYFIYDTERYFVKTVDVKAGKLSITYPSKSIVDGEYTIEVSVKDYDNEQMFKAAEFELTSTLNIFVETDSSDYKPEAIVKITGEATDVQQGKVVLTSAKIVMDNKEYVAKMNENSFSYDLILADNIKTGRHRITVSAKDEKGNSGLTFTDISITAIPTRLETEMMTGSYTPGETVVIRPMLYDQAYDLMQDYVNIQIITPKDEIAMAKSVRSGQKIEFQLPKYARPGEWAIRAEYGELEAENIINVEEVRSLLAQVTGNAVAILNEGNVKEKESIGLELTGDEGTFDFKSREKILPGESATIGLNTEAPSGIYTLAVKMPTGEEVFENVVIADGKPIKSANALLGILITLSLGMMLFMSVLPKVKSIHPKMHEEDYKKFGQRKEAADIKLKLAEMEAKKEFDDYKMRTLEEIRRTEDQDKTRRLQAIYSDKPWRKTAARQPVYKPAPKDNDGIGGAAGFFGGF